MSDSTVSLPFPAQLRALAPEERDRLPDGIRREREFAENFMRELGERRAANRANPAYHRHGTGPAPYTVEYIKGRHVPAPDGHRSWIGMILAGGGRRSLRGDD